MPLTTADFEELQHAQLTNLSGMGWSAPLVQANYGGGYRAGVIANQDYGLHRWQITSEFLPDQNGFSIDYDVDGTPTTDYYFTYFFEFFKRHILLGNKPFKIFDARENKYYLVAFETTGEIDFSRITAKFFTLEGISVIEARHADLAFNADGSLVMPDTEPPTDIIDLAYVSHTYSRIVVDFTAPTDNIGVTGYQYRLNGGSWINCTPTGTTIKTLTIIGLAESTAYDIEVRSRDAAANYSNPSNLVSQTTDAAPNYVMHLYGDSIVGNQSGSDLLGSKLNYYSDNLFTITRHATDGASLGAIDTLISTYLSVDNVTERYVFAYGGTNDNYNDQTSSSVISSPKDQNLADRVETLMSNIHSKGTNTKAIACTMHAFGTIDATHETLRQDANALIISGSGADFTVDLGNHFAYSDNTYFKSLAFFYNDKIHLANGNGLPSGSPSYTFNGYDILALLILNSLGYAINCDLKAIFFAYRDKIFVGDDLPVEHAVLGGDSGNQFKWYVVDENDVETLASSAANPANISNSYLPAGNLILRLKALDASNNVLATRDFAFLCQMPNSAGSGLLIPADSTSPVSSDVDLVATGFSGTIKWIKESGGGTLTGSTSTATYTTPGSAESAVIRAEEEFYSVASNADNTLDGTLATTNYTGVVKLTHPGHFVITPPIPSGFHANNRLGVTEGSSGKVHQIYGDGHLHTVEGAGATATDTNLSASFAAGDRFKFERGDGVLLVSRIRAGVETLLHTTAAATLQDDGVTYYLKPYASFFGANQTIGRWSVGGVGLAGERPAGWNSAEALIDVS